LAEKKVVLTARIAGGVFGDLYPYELFLEEGFSRVYQARLTLLSDTPHSPEELAPILDNGISLTIAQVLWDGYTQRRRYLHGIVTALTVNGVFSSGSQHYYSYGLTIEGQLARLRLNRRNGTYYRQSPVDAVEQVLTGNGIAAQFSDYIQRSDYSTSLMFNQNEISDWDFIRGILSVYGLSFTNIHPAVAEGSVGAADLIFSDGNSFPAPVFDYSDGREGEETTRFDFVRADEAQRVWKMDDFRIERAIGVDGLRFAAVYPEFNYGNDDWKAGQTGRDKRCISYNRLLTGYERGTSKEEIDTDITRVLNARFRAFELAKERWTGKAANLLLMPGGIFELSRFYGLNDEETITALVTSAKTHVRSAWPEHLAAKPENAEIGELTEVEFACMNYAGGIDRRYCGRADD
jgi:uncharacterized protein involved in type VI secretion and phage assembly